jgi:cytochrome P450
MLMPDSDAVGFWAVTRHADIERISKNAKLFCSGQGVQFQDIPEDLLEAGQPFLAMDDPRHVRLRKLVSAAFTPKQVRRIEDRIAQRAETIGDELIEHGDGDFVERPARPLPMWMIFDLMGLPESEQDSVADAADFEAHIGTAVEEFVRFATPVLTFRRTATDHVDLCGQDVAAGDKVVTFYESGNRDGEVFGDPFSFDITRHPIPRVGFGAAAAGSAPAPRRSARTPARAASAHPGPTARRCPPSCRRPR